MRLISALLLCFAAALAGHVIAAAPRGGDQSVSTKYFYFVQRGADTSCTANCVTREGYLGIPQASFRDELRINTGRSLPQNELDQIGAFPRKTSFSGTTEADIVAEYDAHVRANIAAFGQNFTAWLAKYSTGVGTADIYQSIIHRGKKKRLVFMVIGWDNGIYHHNGAQIEADDPTVLANERVVYGRTAPALADPLATPWPADIAGWLRYETRRASDLTNPIAGPSFNVGDSVAEAQARPGTTRDPDRGLKCLVKKVAGCTGVYDDVVTQIGTQDARYAVIDYHRRTAVDRVQQGNEYVARLQSNRVYNRLMVYGCGATGTDTEYHQSFDWTMAEKRTIDRYMVFRNGEYYRINRFDTTVNAPPQSVTTWRNTTSAASAFRAADPLILDHYLQRFVNASFYNPNTLNVEALTESSNTALCANPPPAADQCANLPGVQASVPSALIRSGANCICGNGNPPRLESGSYVCTVASAVANVTLNVDGDGEINFAMGGVGGCTSFSCPYIFSTTVGTGVSFSTNAGIGWQLGAIVDTSTNSQITGTIAVPNVGLSVRAIFCRDGEVFLSGVCNSMPPADVCLNLAGTQSNVPVGLVSNGTDCMCPIAGYTVIENFNGTVTCQAPPATDVCQNLAGIQTSVPSNLVQSGSTCVCSNAAATLIDNGNGTYVCNIPVVPTTPSCSVSNVQCISGTISFDYSASNSVLDIPHIDGSYFGTIAGDSRPTPQNRSRSVSSGGWPIGSHSVAMYVSADSTDGANGSWASCTGPTAVCAAVPPVLRNVTINVVGQGEMGTSEGTNCFGGGAGSPACSRTFQVPVGTSVTFYASAAAGWQFAALQSSTNPEVANTDISKTAVFCRQTETWDGSVCVPPPADVCQNLVGLQTSVPTNLVQSGSNCVCANAAATLVDNGNGTYACNVPACAAPIVSSLGFVPNAISTSASTVFSYATNAASGVATWIFNPESGSAYYVYNNVGVGTSVPSWPIAGTAFGGPGRLDVAYSFTSACGANVNAGASLTITTTPPPPTCSLDCGSQWAGSVRSGNTCVRATTCNSGATITQGQEQRAILNPSSASCSLDGNVTSIAPTCSGGTPPAATCEARFTNPSVKAESPASLTVSSTNASSAGTLTCYNNGAVVLSTATGSANFTRAITFNSQDPSARCDVTFPNAVAGGSAANCAATIEVQPRDRNPQCSITFTPFSTQAGVAGSMSWGRNTDTTHVENASCWDGDGSLMFSGVSSNASSWGGSWTFNQPGWASCSMTPAYGALTGPSCSFSVQVLPANCVSAYGYIIANGQTSCRMMDLETWTPTYNFRAWGSCETCNNGSASAPVERCSRSTLAGYSNPTGEAQACVAANGWAVN